MPADSGQANCKFAVLLTLGSSDIPTFSCLMTVEKPTRLRLRLDTLPRRDQSTGGVDDRPRTEQESLESGVLCLES
jgi:hypothetical protein